jgi:hypothetical protein
MQRGKPRLSFVHYKTDFGGGIQTIDLSKNILLDKPKKNLANILTQKSR